MLPDEPADRLDAEALLFELAAELQVLPFEDGTRTLHLRALELKRVLSAWRDEPPNVADQQGMRNEILRLLQETRDWRERL